MAASNPVQEPGPEITPEPAPKLPRRPRAPRKARTKIESADLKAEAMGLRRAGIRVPVIAERLGVGESTVFTWIKDALQASYLEPAEDMVRMELERLDALQAALWPKATRGDRNAVDTLLRVMERRSRYLKLDQDSSTGAGEVGALLDKLLTSPPTVRVEIERTDDDGRADAGAADDPTRGRGA